MVGGEPRRNGLLRPFVLHAHAPRFEPFVGLNLLMKNVRIPTISICEYRISELAELSIGGSETADRHQWLKPGA
jgi:hypothetical protein